MNQITLNITNVSAVDMTSVYTYLIHTDNEYTNQIVVGQSLPEGVDFVCFKSSERAGKTIVIDKDVKALQDIVDVIQTAKNTDAYDVAMHGCPIACDADMTELYTLATFVANTLRIACPQILMISDMGMVGAAGMAGLALNAGGTDCRTTMILLNSQVSFTEQCKSLIHEMRHAWQHEKHQIRFYGKDNEKYRYWTDYPEDKKQAYYLQKAEIDAEAFAWRVMKDTFGADYTGTKHYDEVNRKLKLEMLQMPRLDLLA